MYRDKAILILARLGRMFSEHCSPPNLGFPCQKITLSLTSQNTKHLQPQNQTSKIIMASRSKAVWLLINQPSNQPTDRGRCWRWWGDVTISFIKCLLPYFVIQLFSASYTSEGKYCSQSMILGEILLTGYWCEETVQELNVFHHVSWFILWSNK